MKSLYIDFKTKAVWNKDGKAMTLELKKYHSSWQHLKGNPALGEHMSTHCTGQDRGLLK